MNKDESIIISLFEVILTYNHLENYKNSDSLGFSSVPSISSSKTCLFLSLMMDTKSSLGSMTFSISFLNLMIFAEVMLPRNTDF